MASVSDIKKDVRCVLDYNEETSALIGFGDPETESIDKLIEGHIEEAGRMVVLMAPRSYIKWETKNLTSTSNLNIETSPKDFIISLPSDFLRFGSAYLNGWERHVNTYCTPDDEEYAKINSSHSGIAANTSRPVVAIVEGVGVIMKPYGSTGSFKYAKQISISSGSFDIASSLYDAFINVCAALVAESLKDTDKSNQLMQVAKNLLTNPDELAVNNDNN